MFRTDSSELVKVVVDEGCEEKGVMYVVSEVWDNDGCIEVGVSYVNGGEMEEYMKGYDWFDGEIVCNV